jgi:hypothetical protein
VVCGTWLDQNETHKFSVVNIVRAIKSVILEAESFHQKAYPAFVTSPRPPSSGTGDVPVFMFHTVQPEIFEQQLQHLSRNGYRTIDTEEFYLFLTGRMRLTGPSIMITFDDGERSLYRVAFPLLKKYGMKAVNFIVTGRVYENERERPHRRQAMVDVA